MKLKRNPKLILVTALLLVGVVVAVIVGLVTVVFGPSQDGPHKTALFGEPVSIELPAGEYAVVEHDSGARIEIPIGATTEQATVSITEVEPPESEIKVGRAFDFSVGEVELLQPVTIHIPFDLESGQKASEIIALHRNEEAGDWEVVPGTLNSESQTIVVTTSDLSIYSTTRLNIVVEVDADCVVSYGGVDIVEDTVLGSGTDITVSSTVRALKTPPLSNINVYMKPHFTEDVRGYELPDDTEAKTDVSNLGTGDETTLSYTATIDRPGTYAFSCRIYWDQLLLDQELVTSTPRVTVVKADGYGRYIGGDHSVLKQCRPLVATPLVGESVNLITWGHRLSGAPPVNYYSGRLYLYHRGEVKGRFFRARQFNSFIGPNNLPLVSAGYTFDSAGSYTLDCELYSHVTGRFSPPPDPFASGVQKLILGFQQLYEKQPINIRSYQGVMTTAFEVTTTRWGHPRLEISPQSLPEEGGEIAVKVRTDESKGNYISAPEISVTGIESGRPMSECSDEAHEVDRGGYVARAWCATFTIPHNSSTDRAAVYTVTASSDDIDGSPVSAVVSVAGAPPPPPPPPPSASDRQALVALYQSTNGGRWKNTVQGNQPWAIGDPNPDLDEWYGVEAVDGNSNRARSLILEENCLDGELPSEIGSLAHLDTLILTGHNRDGCGDLEGRIPDSIGFLANLTLLDLSNNNLTGEIPDALGNPRSKLFDIYLSNNRLSGEIPASLGNLKSLYSLDLRNNRLEGQIPPTLADLPNLEELYLSGGQNEFTGCIPEELFDIEDHDLSELNLETCDETTSLPSDSRFSSVSSGPEHTCGLREDGSAMCWGRIQSTPPEGETFSAISFGGAHGCGLRENGSVVCWGWNDLGQASPPEGENFSAISGGGRFTCGLRTDGSASCWGYNLHGAVSPPKDETFLVISSSIYHTCGLREDGSALCWGDNSSGESSPPRNETLVTISSGLQFTCGLREDGSALCWGNNGFGRSSPPEDEIFAAISSGSFFACGLRRDGSVLCWGSNQEGQSTPPEGETFSAISCGAAHACGLRENGSVVCWGWNEHGQASPP